MSVVKGDAVVHEAAAEGRHADGLILKVVVVLAVRVLYQDIEKRSGHKAGTMRFLCLA